MMAEDEEDADDPEADSLDFGFLISSGLSDEGLAVIEAAEDQVQEAMAAIEKNRRTLKEARARQHFVKMSRQYYKSTSKGKGRGMSTSTYREEHSGIYKCLRKPQDVGVPTKRAASQHCGQGCRGTFCMLR